MLVIHARMQIARNHRDRFLAAVARITEATRAEPGNQEYAFYQAVDSDEDFLLVEGWDDREALDRHFAMGHFEEFRRVMVEAVTRRDAQVFETSGPQPLAPPGAEA